MRVITAISHITFVYALIVFSSSASFSQEINKDSVNIKQNIHSPSKATLLSAFIPGSGQIYNKKYWKVPFIYGGIAAFAIAIKNNNDKYELYRKAYVNRVDDDSTTVDNFPDFSAEILLSRRDIFRRNRDISIISLTLVYILQIVDAHVDAHLFSFNVDENLSLQVTPQAIPIQNALHPGLSFTLNITK